MAGEDAAERSAAYPLGHCFRLPAARRVMRLRARPVRRMRAGSCAARRTARGRPPAALPGRDSRPGERQLK